MNTTSFPQRTRRSARGLTLVELLAVLAISSILLGTAVPSFRSVVRSAKLNSATDSLFSSLLIARSEAAKRRSRVALCKSSDGSNCTVRGGWEQGWIVFHDANNNGLREQGEQVVWRVQAMPSDMRLLGNLNVAKYVSYASTGETKLASGAFQAGTITLCDASSTSEEARQIVLSSAGRPRVQKTRVANCL